MDLSELEGQCYVFLPQKFNAQRCQHCLENLDEHNDPLQKTDCTNFVGQRYNKERCKSCLKPKYSHEPYYTAAMKPPPTSTVHIESSSSLLKDNEASQNDSDTLIRKNAGATPIISNRSVSQNAFLQEDKRKSVAIVGANQMYDSEEYKSETLKRLEEKAEAERIKAEKKAEMDRKGKEAAAYQKAKNAQLQAEKDMMRRRSEQNSRNLQDNIVKDEQTAMAIENLIMQRMRSGMPRTIASGKSTAERMELTHKANQGKWKSVDTHLGIKRNYWTCCNGQVQGSWCLRYKGKFPEEDQPSKAKQDKLLAEMQQQAKAREELGVPKVVAEGETKEIRMFISHTMNNCIGVKQCQGKCKAKWVENNGMGKWSCCRKFRKASWCDNYEDEEL